MDQISTRDSVRVRIGRANNVQHCAFGIGIGHQSLLGTSMGIIDDVEAYDFV